MSYLNGCDLSVYNPVNDWDTFLSQVSFVITRATLGSTKIDGLFRIIWNKLAERKTIRGAYHLFIPKINPDDQVNNLLNVVTDRPDIPLILDAELPAQLTDVRWGQCSPAEITDYVWNLLVGIENRTARIPTMYSRGSWINDWLLPTHDWDHFNLHVARYGTQFPFWAGDKYKPKYWNIWKMWQYSADGNHLGKQYGLGCDSIDLDYFQGTLDELKLWCGLPVVVNPPVLSLEERVVRIETEARLHGWTI